MATNGLLAPANIFVVLNAVLILLLTLPTENAEIHQEFGFI